MQVCSTQHLLIYKIAQCGTPEGKQLELLLSDWPLGSRELFDGIVGNYDTDCDADVTQHVPITSALGHWQCHSVASSGECNFLS